MWKYDTGIRTKVPIRKRSLAGQGFAGNEVNDLAIFDVSRRYKSRGHFAMQAACDAAVSKTKGKRNWGRARIAGADASGNKAESV
ncbi:hypothetical protein CBA19CS22_24080 [Caballeronia novacaledonica]|jgi:hypothetical protein|uniref:Uncharacterized protein n=1 Tax=Caballeronia novacaledonica TaxID=1544861 RepID=A0ACB5QYI3_9BURK|nr:hypothetical protein CBA19CS22_24080 [Caballeronia novacaledonica]